MTTHTTPGRKPKFDDEDVADAIADLRSNNTSVTPAAISAWLNEAGIAKSPNSEALKKSIQRVLDREKEEERRRLLAALPSWVVAHLDPGIDQITSLMHLLAAEVYEQLKKSADRVVVDANQSINFRDKQISELEHEVDEVRSKLSLSAARLDDANVKIALLESEREQLRSTVLELKGAKAALEAVVESLKPAKAA